MNPTHGSFTVEEAKRTLERYCVYQERCHKEVVEKLRKMNMIQLAIDEVVGHLIEHDFLNETRFAGAFARGKFRIKSWGKQRIIRELKMRGLNDRTIKVGLQEIESEDYYHVFDTLSRKRNNQLKEKDKYKRRKKLADYLLYRGWESNLVYEKIQELIP